MAAGDCTSKNARRWLTYKNDEINRLNEVNRLSEKQAAEKLQKLKAQEELADKGRAIMSPENRVDPGMLDSVPGAGFGLGAEARLPSAVRRELSAHQGGLERENFSSRGLFPSP